MTADATPDSEASVELSLNPTVFAGSGHDLRDAFRDAFDHHELAVRHDDDRVRISGTWTNVVAAIGRCHQVLQAIGHRRHLDRRADAMKRTSRLMPEGTTLPIPHAF